MVEEKEESSLQEKLKSFISENTEMTQALVSKKLGVSATALSQWLKGIYPGNTIELVQKVKSFLELQLQQKKHEFNKIRLNFEMTSVADRIFQIAGLAQQNCEIAAIYGASGLGKTTAITQLQKEKSGIIVIDPYENTSPKTIIRTLADNLEISQECYGAKLKKEIELRLKNSGYLIIVDESENLKSGCFQILRKFHDRCDFTFGLLFVGTEIFYKKLLKMKSDFAYVANRIGYTELLKPLEDEDVIKLVKQVFPNADKSVFNEFVTVTKNNARIFST